MVVISVSELEKYFGERLLFSAKGFDVSDNDRIGLVGANGTGKTTLFKMLTGEIPPDSGSVSISRYAKIGCMEQHVVNVSDHSAYEEVLAGFSDLISLEKEIEALHIKLSMPSPDLDKLIKLHHEKSEEFHRRDGLTFRSRARASLLGLGFSEYDLSRPISDFSGGERSKLSLAKLIVSESNLLLLDEPTNHLDIDTVAWLEDFIKTYKGAVIVISHDRYFLDKVATRILEIENKKIQSFNGNFSGWLEKKKNLREIALHHYKNALSDIRRTQDSIKTLKSFNKEKSIKRAESKEKMLARMMSALEKPEDETEGFSFSFPTRRVSGNDVLLCNGLSKSFGDKLIFQNANLDVKRGETVFLLGGNGCGKTTLLKEILSQKYGVRFGASVDYAYYDQTLANLDSSKQVIEELWDAYPKMTQTALRNNLAAFLFKGDEVYKPIKALSGGERAKVALLKIMLSGANLLILDEPTNHLDIYAMEALEDALNLYEGTLLIVSHDRFFINRLADKVYHLDKNGTTLSIGDYDEYLRNKPASAPAMQTKSKTVQNEYRQRKEQAANERKLAARIKKLEDFISQKELEADAIERRLAEPDVASDYIKVSELTALLSQIHEEIESALEELILIHA